MIIAEKENREVEVAKAIKCDVCGKVCSCGIHSGDGGMEAQEFVMIKHSCGYNSIFGDGNVVRIDMCQECFKEKLGAHIRIEAGDEKIW